MVGKFPKRKVARVKSKSEKAMQAMGLEAINAIRSVAVDSCRVRQALQALGEGGIPEVTVSFYTDDFFGGRDADRVLRPRKKPRVSS